MASPTTVTTLPTDMHADLNVTSLPPMTSHTTWTVMSETYAYLAIGALGMLDNLLVLVVIFNVPRMRRKLTNIYIINQSALDFCVSMFLVGSATAGSKVPYQGLAGELYCRLWSTKLFLWGFLVSSTYNLVALTLERYTEVVHPIWHKLSFTRRRAYVSLVVIWIMGPLFNAAYMIPSSTILPGTRRCRIYAEWGGIPEARKVFGVFTVLLQYLLPLTVLVYAYGWIIHQLRARRQPPLAAAAAVSKEQPQQQQQRGRGGGGRVARDDRYHRARRNTLKTLVLVSLCFIACWSGNQVYFLMMNLGFPADFSSPFYHFTVIAVFLNCCVNPFIYALKYEPFQLAAVSMFCRCWPIRNRVSDLDKALAAPQIQYVGSSENDVRSDM